ncbi:MAG TPA: zinc ribbon domain-containing protein [Terriglobales bacterium]|nr:zinc ribbon domain-containing protein [Terriglobales bacterium]
MPIYEYQCKRCHHRFERIQKFADPLIKKCPQCGGPVEQLLSPPAVQFKGSGWYATDYANKARAPSTKEDSAPPAESETKAESGAKKDEKAKSEPKKAEKK